MTIEESLMADKKERIDWCSIEPVMMKLPAPMITDKLLWYRNQRGQSFAGFSRKQTQIKEPTNNGPMEQ